LPTHIRHRPLILCRISETLSEEVLSKLHAGPKSSYTIIDATSLENYDAFLFGIPTRFGNFPAQWKTFWDTTGKQWSTGGFWGKYVGLFIGTATQGGGQESTALAAMSTLAAHGMIFVSLGYKTTLNIQSNLDEARGGSPWGAGTYTVGTILHWITFNLTDRLQIQGLDGSRMPSALELELATIQGESFGQAINKVTFD